MRADRDRPAVDPEVGTSGRAGRDRMITTGMIGFSDCIDRTSATAIAAGARQLVEGVRHGTLMGRVGTRRFTRGDTVLKEVFDTGHGTGKITLFDPWNWPDASDIWANDRIHLNDNGYRHLATSVLAAMVAHGAVT